MVYINIVGLKCDEIKMKKCISLKTLNSLINIQTIVKHLDIDMLYNENKITYVNDYVNKNVNNYKIINNNIEILICELININKSDININQINDIENVIYSISFIGNLFITLRVNNKIETINHKFFLAHSFQYNNDCNLDLYPINMNVELLDDNIYYSITYAFCDSTYIKNNNINSFNIKDKNYNTNSSFDKINNDELLYIDINKEFL